MPMHMHMPKQFSSMEETCENFAMPVQHHEFVARGGTLIKADNAGFPSEGTAMAFNKGLVTSLTRNAALIAGPSQNSYLELSDPHLNEQAEESKIFPLLPNGRTSSEVLNGCILKPSDGQLDKIGSDMFEVHFSDSCQKRFIMFDQNGSRNQIIFHPSMVYELSDLPQLPSKIANLKEQRLEKHLKDAFGDHFCWDEPDYLRALVPQGWQSVLFSSTEGDLFQTFSSAEGLSKDRDNACLSKENSEDLDALLWSDDELSSEGHSSSNLKWSDEEVVIANVGTVVNVEKKRKACAEAETDSTANSMKLTAKGVLQTEFPHLSGASGYDKHAFAVCDLSLPDEESSNGGKKSIVHERANKKTRKDKAQTTLQLLRSIIPGAVSMDAACLLGEAARYVKKLEVELEKLEGMMFL